MAMLSDAMYDARSTVTSYVSSNAYYGYVPHCTRTNQGSGCIGECNDAGSAVIIGSHRCNDNEDMAMETDDDGYGYYASSSRLNNHSVIAETSPSRNRQSKRLEPVVVDAQQQWCRSQQRTNMSDTCFSKNRKRCSNDYEPARELKRFREGGGNSRVYYNKYDTRSTKDYGLAQMHYESTSFCLSSADWKSLKQPLIAVESCCWAAGNSSFINNPGHKGLFSSNDSKPNKSNIDYERMLFETHGCSIYHQQRMQLLESNHIEAEF